MYELCIYTSMEIYLYKYEEVCYLHAGGEGVALLIKVILYMYGLACSRCGSGRIEWKV